MIGLVEGAGAGDAIDGALLEMVLQVTANAGTVDTGLDASGLERGAGADAGTLEDLD